MTAGNPERGTAEADRQQWLSVLARARASEVAARVAELDEQPDYRLLRAPETGLVMVRGRAGGTGRRFNLGEMTVTRCSVRLGDGIVGHGFVAGRDKRHAEQAAVLDALLQRDPSLGERVIGPLARAQNDRRDAALRKAAATRVDFFTLVRGED